MKKALYALVILILFAGCGEADSRTNTLSKGSATVIETVHLGNIVSII